MIIDTRRLIYSSLKAMLILSLLFTIVHWNILSGAFPNPIITTYPVSWAMVVAGFVLLLISWRVDLTDKVAYALPSAMAGLGAVIYATPKACTAGFNGFSMLALLLLAKPFSAYWGLESKPMPRWATLVQAACVGAAIYAMIAIIASYQLPPPPK